MTDVQYFTIKIPCYPQHLQWKFSLILDINPLRNNQAVTNLTEIQELQLTAKLKLVQKV